MNHDNGNIGATRNDNKETKRKMSGAPPQGSVTSVPELKSGPTVRLVQALGKTGQRWLANHANGGDVSQSPSNMG